MGSTVDVTTRVESELGAILALHGAPAGSQQGPPGLSAALRYAVFPGGARIRPRLCLAVAQACGDDQPVAASRAAAAIELLHCASLVHDDLPCFDDAELRRGKPSVHKAFGERLAVLAGDGLIVLAFQALARIGEVAPRRLAALLVIIGRAVAGPTGIVAGQAWECEPQVVLADYQRAKTGALFAAATMAGAAAAGRDPSPWDILGQSLGEAFQVADDIRDVVAESAELGKPVGRDAALGRPSAVALHGLAGAIEYFDQLVAGAMDVVPACPGAASMRALIAAEADKLLPKKIARRAA
jgi:geranylgeranyl diphosphate synthase type II